MDLRLERWASQAQLFVEPTGPDSEVSGRGLGGTFIDIVPEGTHLARGGYSEQRADVNRDNVPSYVYRNEAPLVEHGQLQEAQLTGSFRLFVHGVTLEVTHGQDGSWQNWTGFRETQTSDASSEYELRVTTIDVEGGRLEVGNTSAISLLSTSTETQVDGSIATDSARGTLRAGGEEIQLGGRPLELSGTGDISAIARGTQEPTIFAQASGNFEVLSLDDAPSVQESSGVRAPSEEPLLWTGASVLGFVALAAVAIRRPRLLRPLPAGIRDPLYRRWLSAGRSRENDQEFEAAASFYGRLTALDPANPIGWYHHSRALLDAGRSHGALRVASQARQRLDSAPLDLLEVEVAASIEASRPQAAKRALLELAKGSPEMARGLVEDLGIEELGSEEEIREALGPEEEPGGLQGYV